MTAATASARRLALPQHADHAEETRGVGCEMHGALEARFGEPTPTGLRGVARGRPVLRAVKRRLSGETYLRRGYRIPSERLPDT